MWDTIKEYLRPEVVWFLVGLALPLGTALNLFSLRTLFLRFSDSLPGCNMV